MQVAMIAQGEFMELLRAKSDDKKNDFSKTVSYGTLSENSGRTEDKMQRERRRISEKSERYVRLRWTYLCAGRI